MKNKLSKGLSLSANPNHLIKGVFFATMCVKCDGIFKRRVQKGTRAKKFLADDVQGGKSMIEMLGVLAIIAVLTVGGITGYSKAMKKYQANKVVGEITQLLANLKEVSEHDKVNIYYLDAETKKALGLCLPSAENCSRYQPTPVVTFYMTYDSAYLVDADAELCISAFNNIVIPLKSNIKYVIVNTDLRDINDTVKELKECEKKCRDKCKKDRDCLVECGEKCSDNADQYRVAICMDEDKKNCREIDGNYLNLHDARVVTEVNALCNRGFNKKNYIAIYFKEGFFK